MPYPKDFYSYDTNLLGNFYAYPSFQRKFGDYVGVTEQTPSGYSLTAGWQSGLGQGAGKSLIPRLEFAI